MLGRLGLPDADQQATEKMVRNLFKKYKTTDRIIAHLDQQFITVTPKSDRDAFITLKSPSTNPFRFRSLRVL